MPAVISRMLPRVGAFEAKRNLNRVESLSRSANSNNSLDGYAAMNVPARKEALDEILAEDEQKEEKSRWDSS